MPAGRLLCSSLAVVGILGQPVLVSVHGVRRRKPVAVGIHELVPSDVDASETRVPC